MLQVRPIAGAQLPPNLAFPEVQSLITLPRTSMQRLIRPFTSAPKRINAIEAFGATC
jgi:hypothetical protein